MADVYKTSKNLKIETVFVDGDTRTITLKNPKTTLTEEDFSSLNTWMQANQPIVGDKYGGTFGRINEARTVSTVTRYLDLST